jgi:hypothetical protein
MFWPDLLVDSRSSAHRRPATYFWICGVTILLAVRQFS